VDCLWFEAVRTGTLLPVDGLLRYTVRVSGEDIQIKGYFQRHTLDLGHGEVVLRALLGGFAQFGQYVCQVSLSISAWNFVSGV